MSKAKYRFPRRIWFKIVMSNNFKIKPKLLPVIRKYGTILMFKMQYKFIGPEFDPPTSKILLLSLNYLFTEIYLL